MDNEKRIMVIGCGTNSQVQDAINRMSEHSGVVPTFHMIEPDISKEALRVLALKFQEQDFDVAIVSTGLDNVPDFTESLRPELPTLELTIPDGQHYLRDVYIPEEPRGVNPNSRNHRGKKKYWKR